MMQNRKPEIITVLAILGFIVVFLVASQGGDHTFRGSDDLGSLKIAELTGKPVESYTPLIPQYKPPGGEIEGTLFALQAAFGGIILGFIMGYWLGKKKVTPHP